MHEKVDMAHLLYLFKSAPCKCR